MEEAERLCDRIVIIDHGRVIADDTVQGLYRQLPNSSTVELQFELTPADDGLLAALSASPGILAVSRSDSGVKIETEDFAAALARALSIVAGRGLRVVSVQTARTSLEDVFIRLTGHGLRDGPLAQTDARAPP
jgi:ABC-2 type transport system ATP-binding protein